MDACDDFYHQRRPPAMSEGLIQALAHQALCSPRPPLRIHARCERVDRLARHVMAIPQRGGGFRQHRGTCLQEYALSTRGSLVWCRLGAGDVWGVWGVWGDGADRSASPLLRVPRFPHGPGSQLPFRRCDKLGQAISRITKPKSGAFLVNCLGTGRSDIDARAVIPARRDAGGHSAADDQAPRRAHRTHRDAPGHAPSLGNPFRCSGRPRENRSSARQFALGPASYRLFPCVPCSAEGARTP